MDLQRTHSIRTVLAASNLKDINSKQNKDLKRSSNEQRFEGHKKPQHLVASAAILLPDHMHLLHTYSSHTSSPTLFYLSHTSSVTLILPFPLDLYSNITFILPLFHLCKTFCSTQKRRVRVVLFSPAIA